ncbi:MAG TPA: TrmH family RNA methyltransferase [Candidatus Polarisedimenticolaceae bacterium]|nr:TrmH family RNA methyltransferase [Candidatus Polarisedimenticolaceae bacterium]
MEPSRITHIRCPAEACRPRLPLALLADNVRSLWNVGAMFRTADACGLSRIVLAGITGCPPRPEIRKTALGADELVPWCHHADGRDALACLEADGYVPVAIETSARAVPLDRLSWPSRVVLVVGNEVRGVGGELLAACPHHVRIPMRGVKESFNVAVAFGIVAYQAALALDR